MGAPRKIPSVPNPDSNANIPPDVEEHKKACLIVIKAYEGYLKETIQFDSAKRILAVDAMQGGMLTRNINHAETMASTMSQFEQRTSDESQKKDKLGDNAGPLWPAFNKDFDLSGKDPTTFQDIKDEAGERWDEGTDYINRSAFDRDSTDNKYDDGYRATNEFHKKDSAYDSATARWLDDNMGPAWGSRTERLADSWKGFLSGEDDTSDVIVSWLEDCIPCTDRWKAIEDLKPFDDLMDLIKEDIAKRFGILNKIGDLFNNTDIIDDICALAYFLDFLCIPDIVTLIAVLNMLLVKLLQSINFSLSDALWNMLSSMLTPPLAGLRALLDQYISILFAPIECILDAMSHQLSKIPGAADAQKALIEFRHGSVQDAKQIARDVAIGKKAYRGNPMAEAQDNIQGSPYTESYWDTVGNAVTDPPDYHKNLTEEFSVMNTLQLAPEYLFYYTALGAKMITDIVSSLDDAMHQLLSADWIAMWDGITVAESVRRISRLIGIAEAIVRLAKGGSLCPGLKREEAHWGEGYGQAGAEMVIEEYNAMSYDTFKIVKEIDTDGTIKFKIVSPELISGEIDDKDEIGGLVPKELIPPEKEIIVDTCYKQATPDEYKRLAQYMTDLQSGAVN